VRLCIRISALKEGQYSAMGLLNRRNQNSVEDNHLNAHEYMYVKWCSIKDMNLHEMILVVSTNHSKKSARTGKKIGHQV